MSVDPPSSDGEREHLRTQVAELEAELQAARQRADFLARVIDAAPIGLAVTDAEGRFVLVNPRLGELLGRPVESLPGEPFLGVVADPVREEAATAHAEVLAGRSVGPADWPFHRGGLPAGRVHVEHAVLDTPAGRFRVAATTEVTRSWERSWTYAESDAVLRAFCDSAPFRLGVVELTEADFRFLWVNPFFAAQMATLAGEPIDVVGRPASELVADPAEFARWLGHYRRAWEEGRPVNFETDEPVTGRRLSATVSPVASPADAPPRLCFVVEDVTDRRRAEEAARESERRLRLAVEAAGVVVWGRQVEDFFHQFAEHCRDAVWVAEWPSRRLLFINAAYTERYGVDREAAAANPFSWRRVLHPDDRDRVIAVKETLPRGEPFELEYRVVRPDGSVRWILDRSFPIFDGTGRLVRVAGIATDITARREAEEARSESEARFRLFAQQSRDVLWIATPIGQPVFVSEAFRTVWGRPPESIHGNRRGWLETIHPEDLPRIMNYPAGELPDVEYRIIRPDGEVRWIRDRAFQILGAGGERRYAAGIAQDITEQVHARQELRRRERELAALIEHVPDLIVRFDRDLRHVFVNPAVAALAGRPLEELLGRPHDELGVPEATAQAWQLGLRRALATGERSEVQVELAGPDGRPVLFHGRVVPECGESGEVETVLVILRDITAVRAEHTRRLDVERHFCETQRLESLGVLAGGIAHDFNNLLTGILAHASLATDDLTAGAGERAAGRLRQVELSARRAADLCGQLLAYAGKGRFIVRPLDLSDLVRETVELVRVSVAHRAELHFDLAGSPATVRGDATQLRQVLMNLVLNAAQSLGEPGGTVTVGTGSRRLSRGELDPLPGGLELTEGEYVYLRVTDTGCGMDPLTRSRIFEPFFTTKFTGRGLGLAAVLGIARGHGGTLRVESAPGVGSTFELLLPPDTLPAEPTPEAVPAALARPPGGLVLVVDDEPAVRDAVAALVRSLGYDAVEAFDRQSAVAEFAARPGAFRMALIDLTMPGMDGEALLRRLRELDPGLPVLVMSGYAESEVGPRFGGEAAVGFLQKPFRRQELAAALAALEGDRSIGRGENLV